MLFNSLQFLLFFPAVTLIYFLIPMKIRYLWLLAASYYFYMGWNARYALLLLTSTLVTYLSGILLEAVSGKVKAETEEDELEKKAAGGATERGQEKEAAGGMTEGRQADSRSAERELLRKLIVAGSFAINLGILFFYKYYQFATDILVRLFARMRIGLIVPRFDVLLPVGISFFTFQALSYTADVYRGEIYAEKNFFRYALYVSFFPQLVAGPIERSKNLLRQLAKPSGFQFEKAREGLLLMLWGYFLKIVLADRISIVVDTVYENHTQYKGWFLIVATVLFAIQIYCDFAGYSTIAIGAAEILGVDLMKNFDAPYTARSVAEFWRRWHISLTSWFRDYVYIPLGGNRKGTARKWVNRIAVFFLSGLWHGASFHFVAWGLLNGLYQVIGEILLPVREKAVRLLRLHPSTIGFRLYRTAFTFILVDFSWIYFRADSLKTAHAVMSSIIHADNPWILFDGSLYQLGMDEKNFRMMLLCIALLIAVDLCSRLGIFVRKILLRQDYPVRWMVFVVSVIFILVFGMWGTQYDANSFIYFQF